MGILRAHVITLAILKLVLVTLLVMDIQDVLVTPLVMDTQDVLVTPLAMDILVHVILHVMNI
jgi:hypothetical protein